MIGRTLGHYEIKEPLGAGGMGEVYLALDTNLDRDVAIKILPEDFASDADRLTRFEREAKLLASLNHVNIASIYGLEDEGDQRFIVMEVVEGETLAGHLHRGPLPVGLALSVAAHIAEALEAAHDKGIIHRDLKPANVMVTARVKVKVLDFGLAKVFEAQAPSSDLSQSPTMGPATQAGVIIGTAAYMSPEQARGRPLDRRTDIWSFGALLYELLTGRPAFQREDVTETLAAVLKDDPDWSRLPQDTPRVVASVLRRCLAKDTRNRLHHIADARIAIAEAIGDPESPTVGAARDPARATAGRGPSWTGAFVMTVTAAVAAGGLAGTMLGGSDVASLGVRHLRLALAEQPVDVGFGAGAVLSPDGSMVALALEGGEPGLYLQHLDLPARDLLVPEQVDNPVFSPDNQWVAYEQAGSLWKIPTAGGSPIWIADAFADRGTAWGPDGTVLVVPANDGPIYRVNVTGGALEAVTQLRAGEVAHRWPQFLPDGGAIVFTADDDGADWTNATVEVLDLETGERETIVRGGFYPRYVASGHVAFARPTGLFAAPFDAATWATGPVVPVVTGVGTNPSMGGAQYSVSDDGTLLYLGGGADTTIRPSQLVRVAVDGAEAILVTEERVISSPRLSPDGSRVAYSLVGGGVGDIWVYDLTRKVAAPVTFEPAVDWYPAWGPEGRDLYYSSSEGLHRRPADGSGSVERVWEATLGAPDVTATLHPDGRLALTVGGGGIALIDFDRGAATPVLVEGAPRARSPSFSPDGRWLAYTSDETGTWEVYVRSLEDGGRWPISRGGGGQPHWARDGRRLYYRAGGSLMVIPVDPVGDALLPGSSTTVLSSFTAPRSSGHLIGGWFMPDYYPGPEGDFFVVRLLGRTDDAEQLQKATFVVNWSEELRRLASER